MTRENKPAAQSAARRAASLLTGALLLAGLAGCSGDFFQFSDNSQSQLDPEGQARCRPVACAGCSAKIRQPRSTISLLLRSRANGVAHRRRQGRRLRHQADLRRGARRKKGTKVAYTIDVTDKAGNKVRTIAGEEVVSPKHGGDSWNHVTDERRPEGRHEVRGRCQRLDRQSQRPAPPAAVASATPAPGRSGEAAAKPAPVKTAAKPRRRLLRAKAQADTPSLASAVDAALRGPCRSLAAAEVIAVVPTVAGAPGDGKTALSEAMKRALGRQGIKLAPRRRARRLQNPGQCRDGRSCERPAADHHPLGRDRSDRQADGKDRRAEQQDRRGQPGWRLGRYRRPSGGRGCFRSHEAPQQGAGQAQAAADPAG